MKERQAFWILIEGGLPMKRSICVLAMLDALVEGGFKWVVDNPGAPGRVQPRALQATAANGAITLPVEVRDYPLLIQWVRLK
jgi:hypothetical protein